MYRPVFFLCVIVLAFSVDELSAMDYVTARRDGTSEKLSGKVLIRARDGGLLFLTRQGQLLPLQKADIVSHQSDEKPFAPYSPEEVEMQILAELPPDFDVYDTRHYLIFYDTSRAYAQWCGALFERLHWAFMNYWDYRDFELEESQFPLVAIIFSNQNDFKRYAREEVGEGAVEAISAYYNLQTNRMVLYDMTGTEQRRRGGGRMTAAQINRILSHPRAASNVSTIVHEATHQIGFNCGLHQRFSPFPLWVAEGIAIFFETPDLKSKRGWRSIGEINHPRLQRLKRFLVRHPSDPIRSLIRDDQLLRNTQTGLDAYALSWGLFYYLMHRHSDDFIEYLNVISQKESLEEDSPEQRVEEFEAAFGDDWAKLQKEFTEYIFSL
jgi:hypothetical protein